MVQQCWCHRSTRKGRAGVLIRSFACKSTPISIQYQSGNTPNVCIAIPHSDWPPRPAVSSFPRYLYFDHSLIVSDFPQWGFNVKPVRLNISEVSSFIKDTSNPLSSRVLKVCSPILIMVCGCGLNIMRGLELRRRSFLQPRRLSPLADGIAR